jgi:alkanesulfonate monooxygenase SsuD/methylene tetrahydromethanopterin reductase-like flavin-dependent oxidoreductase (luciferase family)
MKFGLMCMLSDPGNVPQEHIFREVFEEVEYAEALGFDSVWLSEYHFSVHSPLGDALTLAAAIAQRTSRIKIGTAVVPLPFHHPLRLAEQAALVDVLSAGRLLLGMGRGYQPSEFASFGKDPEQSRSMFQESLSIVQKAFTEENFSYTGHFWNIQDVTLFPKPLQQPHPPFYMAAVTPPSYRLAADLGLPILRSPNFTRMELVEQQWQVYCERLQKRGLDADDMDQPLLMKTYVGETEEEAVRVAEPHARWFHRLLGGLLPGASGKSIPAGYELLGLERKHHEEANFDDLYEWGSCYGTPARVIDLIKQSVKRTGTNHWLADMKFGGMPHDKTMKSMELFARHVMPALRDPQPPWSR